MLRCRHLSVRSGHRPTHCIEDVVEHGAGTLVMAADKLGRLHVRPIVERFDQGEAEVIGLRVADGTLLRATPDHEILTDRAGARPVILLSATAPPVPDRPCDCEPMPADHARLLGYLIGDGYVGGKTPISFINRSDELHADVASIASTSGARSVAACRQGIEAAHLASAG